MTNAPDVIVIGAGVIGCAIARELARRKATVRVFESRTIGAGATHASAGVLAPYIEADEASPLFDLTVRSLAMYDRFVQEASDDSGVTIEYRRCGTLEVATDDASADRLRHAALRSSSASMQWLDADAVRHQEPELAAFVRGGLFVSTHGYVDAAALTEALAWAALRHNAQIETNHRVARIVATGDRLAVLTADGTVWTTGSIVVAAGSWSSDAGFALAAPPEEVRPVRGQLLRLAWHGTPPSQVIWGPNCYVVPWTNGLLLVGATMEDVGFDERTTAAGVRDLLEAACELLPKAWQASFVDARAGLRPATASGLPIIGRSHHHPRVLYATGHFRNGVLLAPLTAQLVADLI
jgi:glycine oxidase